jgi:SAM-dependent methyltransferase
MLVKMEAEEDGTMAETGAQSNCKAFASKAEYPYPRLYQAYADSHTEDLALWKQLAQRSGDPVLELGCGPGRVLCFLAESSFSVSGIDCDAGMLELAERRCFPRFRDRVRLYLANMCDFELPNRYPLIIVPCNTFSFLDNDRAIQALARINYHLTPNGLAAFDLPSPEESIKTALISMQSEEAGALPVDIYFEPKSEHSVQVYASYDIDSSSKRICLTWHFDELFPDGTVKRFDHVLNYHLRSRNEMQDMLNESGMSRVQFYGDYELGPLHSSSSQMIVLAQVD